jgi:hypothetical protein
MELTGILAFIAFFIIIISILIGVAYYSFKEVSYDDTVRGKASNGDIKTDSTATKLKKLVKAKAKKEQESTAAKKTAAGGKSSKKQYDSSNANTHNELSTEEEEPIVLIPDPFTNTVNSRFGSLIAANPIKRDVGSELSKKSNTAVNGHANGAVSKVVQQQQQQQQQQQKPTTTTTKAVPVATIKPVANGSVVNAAQNENDFKNAKTVPLKVCVFYFKTALKKILHNCIYTCCLKKKGQRAEPLERCDQQDSERAAFNKACRSRSSCECGASSAIRRE